MIYIPLLKKKKRNTNAAGECLGAVNGNGVKMCNGDWMSYCE
jgi:hypothetical protein